MITSTKGVCHISKTNKADTFVHRREMLRSFWNRLILSIGRRVKLVCSFNETENGMCSQFSVSGVLIAIGEIISPQDKGVDRISGDAYSPFTYFEIPCFAINAYCKT